MTADPRLPAGADPAELVRLDAIRARRAKVRDDIESGPLARLEHGRRAARGVLAAPLDERTLAALLTAIFEDRPDDARAVLDGLPADEVTAIAYRASVLSDLSAAAAAGRRS